MIPAYISEFECEGTDEGGERIQVVNHVSLGAAFGSHVRLYHD